MKICLYQKTTILLQAIKNNQLFLISSSLLFESK